MTVVVTLFWSRAKGQGTMWGTIVGHTLMNLIFVVTVFPYICRLCDVILIQKVTSPSVDTLEMQIKLYKSFSNIM
jgi:Na+(H+)/acetate symporter ActP